jgi:predicted permease
MLGVCKVFGLSGALFSTIVLSASAPPANNTVLFSAKYGRDTGLASQVVSSVSLMSIITIPLIMGVASVI